MLSDEIQLMRRSRKSRKVDLMEGMGQGRVPEGATCTTCSQEASQQLNRPVSRWRASAREGEEELLQGI
jgi:hypothetical protein